MMSNLHSILMVRPSSFRTNTQTLQNNHFQKTSDSSDEIILQKTLIEFDNLVNKIRSYGIPVTVFQDDLIFDTPDSIFPNNWVSFHQDGRVALYPMCAENRRTERRPDILDKLKEKGFEISSVVDFSGYEAEQLFLEGTGSMILDRQNKICYAALSIRTDGGIAQEFCKEFGYDLVCFTANQTHNDERLPIYHTNVMMCIADRYAIVCMDTIDDEGERQFVESSIKKSGKELIEISEEQKERFAGNMLQVQGNQTFLVMSSSAYHSLTEDQIQQIESFNPIIHSDLNTIEACGGGSARCMLAEIFLPRQEK